MDSLNLLPFGIRKDKQIKLGLDDNFINDYDKKNQTELRKQLDQLLTKFESLFDDRQLPIQERFPHVFFYIGVKRRANVEPIPWSRKNPQFDKQKEDWLRIKIQNLLQLGIISKVDKEPDYINSIEVISKNNEFEFDPNFSDLNNSSNFRFTIEHLNKIPYIEKKIFSIPPSTIFSLFVIKDAAFLFILESSYRKYTSFKLENDKNKGKYDYYEFNTLHPNMRVSFNHIQKNFENFFKPFMAKNIIRIFEDKILILSKTIEDHIVNLRTILNHLNEKNIKISLNDSMILIYELEIFDFWLDVEGISIPSRIKQQLSVLKSTNFSQQDHILIRNLVSKYKRFCENSRGYEENKKKLDGKNDEPLSFFINILSTSNKLPHNLENLQQSSRSNLQKSSRSNLQQSSRSNLQQISRSNLQQSSRSNLQQNMQQIIQRFQQQYLQLIIQQFPQQYLKQNSPMQQYLQQITQQLVQQCLQEIKEQLLDPYQQRDPQLNIQQNLQQYLQQNPHLQQDVQKIIQEFLQKYLQQNLIENLQKNLTEELEQYLLQIGRQFMEHLKTNSTAKSTSK